MLVQPHRLSGEGAMRYELGNQEVEDLKVEFFLDREGQVCQPKSDGPRNVTVSLCVTSNGYDTTLSHV